MEQRSSRARANTTEAFMGRYLGAVALWGNCQLSLLLILGILTEFDPPYFEVIGKHLQLSYQRGVHGRGVLWVPHALPLGVGFHLSDNGSPRGLISREEGRGQ